MSYSQRITYPLDRETHAMVSEMANKSTNANLADMSRILIEEAIEARMQIMSFDDTPDAKIIKRRYLAKIRAEKERWLYEAYIDFMQDSQNDDEYENELLDFAAKYKLPYPPANAAPINVDPHLTKIMNKLALDKSVGEETGHRDLCRAFTYKKDDLDYHLNKLAAMGKIEVTRNQNGKTIVNLSVEADSE